VEAVASLGRKDICVVDEDGRRAQTADPGDHPYLGLSKWKGGGKKKERREEEQAN
jgi:hypothetical protein